MISIRPVLVIGALVALLVAPLVSAGLLVPHPVQTVVPSHGVYGAWLVEDAFPTTPGYSVWDPSVALGPDGSVHVAFGSGCQTLVHAEESSSGWVFEEIVRRPGSCFVNGQQGLAVDGAGVPHYAASDSWMHRVDVYHKTPSGWVVSKVEDQFGTTPGAAVAPDGTVHVVWGTFNPWRVRHAWGLQGSWQVETITTVPIDRSAHARIAIDASGGLHVFFQVDWNSVYYTHYDGSSWSIVETVVPPGAGVALYDAAVTPDGRPAAMLEQLVTGGLLASVLMWKDAGSWQRVEVDTSHARAPALEIDSTGRPHVAFYYLERSLGPNWDYRFGRTVYATPVLADDWTGPWVKETMPYPGEFHRGPAIRLDENDRPVVAWGVVVGGFLNPIDPDVGLPTNLVRVARPVT